jgi:hypothetical protein
MDRRRAPTMLTPTLAAIVLAAFSLTGLMTGVLAHGFFSSLAAGRQTTPTLVRTPPSATVPPTATPVPTQAGPDAKFTLQLTATPQRVAPGGTLTLKVLATVAHTTVPVAHLLCMLRGPRTGGASLLPIWPAGKKTDALGVASWQVTVPQGASGTYTVEVDGAGTTNFTAWSYVYVYVGA